MGYFIFRSLLDHIYLNFSLIGSKIQTLNCTSIRKFKAVMLRNMSEQTGSAGTEKDGVKTAAENEKV